MSCHVTSRHVTSRHVTSCHVMSCHVMSCDVMSWSDELKPCDGNETSNFGNTRQPLPAPTPRLGWAGLRSQLAGLGWAGLGWARLGWVGRLVAENGASECSEKKPLAELSKPIARLGLGWAGLGWAGLGWAGLGWAGRKPQSFSGASPRQGRGRRIR